MQIKPFEAIASGYYDKDTIKSIRVDMHYIPKTVTHAKAGKDENYSNIMGKLIVSKKYLIKFENIGTVFVKLIYIYHHKNTSEINNIEELNNHKDTELKLTNIITSMFDDNYRHYFGNAIYTFTGSGQLVTTVFESKQKYTQEESNNAINTFNNFDKCLYAFIISDNPLKLHIDKNDSKIFNSNGRSFSSTHQLVGDELFKETTSIGELLSNNFVNLEFNGYKSTMYKDMNTFNDSNLLNISQGYITSAIESEKRLGYPASYTLAARDNKLGDMMIYSECLKSMMLEVFKGFKISMIDRMDMTYTSDGDKLHINKVITPFDKTHATMELNAMTSICDKFRKAVDDILTVFDNCIIHISINDAYIFIRIKNKDKDETVDKMVFIDDLINDFVYYNIKSKRFKKNHFSNVMKDNMRMSTMMHYFDKEIEDIPF